MIHHNLILIESLNLYQFYGHWNVLRCLIPIDEKIFDPLKSSNSLKNFADCLNGANRTLRLLQSLISDNQGNPQDQGLCWKNLLDFRAVIRIWSAAADLPVYPQGRECHPFR